MNKEEASNYNEYWQVIAENTGYDFSGYSSDSLNKRLASFVSSERIGSAEELKNRLFTDRLIQDKILRKLLISYTEMFRDPGFFQSLKDQVLPHLAVFPKISIWVAGCATGEEVYSLAMLLHEIDLLNRCEIVATDISEQNIGNAASGIFSLQRLQESGTRYYASGGKRKLADYYTAYYDHVVFHAALKERIKFKQHNLVKDLPPQRFHLVLCRNVLIYFNRDAQRRVLHMLTSCLMNHGYLGLGIQEHFPGLVGNDLFPIDRPNKLFRKIIL